MERPMRIEMVDPAKLDGYERNSRTHSSAQIKQIEASIREFGFTNPILIDEAGGIIAGHGRVLAAKNMELDTVPCIRLEHLSDAQRRAYIIADNKLAENAGWDADLLRLELGALADMEFDLNVIGFNFDELEKILAGMTITDGLIGEDDLPVVKDDPVTVPGDVWQCGPHRVICWDTTDVNVVARLFDGGGKSLFLWLRILRMEWNTTHHGEIK